MKFIALVTALAFATATQAQQTDDPCQGMGLLAAEVMTYRQMGTPLSDLMRPLPKDGSVQLLIEMILIAYEQPTYSSPEFQQIAISEFRNTWEVECYRRIAN